MELRLEVVLSSSIKRKKPWPRFCWLGQEKESVFLLDDRRISEINMVSGRTKKRTPKLHPLLSTVVTMASSQNGMWLCGLLTSGELFLWNRDKDLLKTAAAAPEVLQMITTIQGSAAQLSVQVSGDASRVLLVATTGRVFLWECADIRDLTGLRDGTVKGRWAHILPLEDTSLPSAKDKEASQHAIFVKSEAVGDTCLLAFVFTSGMKLIVTCLKIQWEEGHMRVGSVGYSVRWATETYPMSRLSPPCQPVKSRGALVLSFSPDGRLLAVVLNQRQPRATQVLFVSTQNFVSVSSNLGGCGCKKQDIPSKYIRSYWVGSVSWSPDGLFLACVLKRGSLLMLPGLGGLLTLTTTGCNIDFGPAQFLPLHPLVTYWAPTAVGKADGSLSSSSMSLRDIMRQRYSVTWHPRLFYLIVSDGYMATVLRVLGRPTPETLLRALLRDTSKELEKTSRMLDKSQSHARMCLESMSRLHLDGSLEELKTLVASGPNTPATDGSTVPLFLRDQGTLSGTKELLEKVQAFFEDDSEIDGPPPGSHVKDEGRLEFASMFDTLHAPDMCVDTRVGGNPDPEEEEEAERNALHHQLGRIQNGLLTAWALAMSLGNAVEHQAHLLKSTLDRLVRFAALLHLTTSHAADAGRKSSYFFSSLLHLLKAVLSFLPWDQSAGSHCLRLVVELGRQLARLLLIPQTEFCQAGHYLLSSHVLSKSVLVLNLVSESLDRAYSLQRRSVWSSGETEPPSEPEQCCWPTDVHNVPLLQDDNEEKPVFICHGLPVPQRPSSRLFGVWKWLYEISQQYMEELRDFEGCDGWEEEQQQTLEIRSQIQAALQATGERLEEGPTLLSYPGEHLFLCGSYEDSADILRSLIWEESKKSCHRGVFQETRLCLALLYSLLSQYHLREAQEMGDHMARLILHRGRDQRDKPTAEPPPCLWLPVELHTDTACAVIQTLGRFMASYFANQQLFVLPPHNVAVLPPIHLPHGPTVGRLVPLCQEEAARAVRVQQISEVWTVDYAQDLLMLGGLLPETVWLASHLGDWKAAASLSLAYTNYCSHHFDFTQFKKRELHLPAALQPESFFQAELECLLGSKSGDGDESFTVRLEGQDLDLLQDSMREILKASVMAGVNITSSPLSSLLDTAKDLCSCLPALVPAGLYLPSPPLYCPQPSPNTQDPVGTLGQFEEVALRHKVSGVLQKLLLLLRSARCCHPAAQWYISHLRRAKHIQYKIKKKYGSLSADEEEKSLPEALMKFDNRRGFFRPGPHKALDPDAIQTIMCFRELCGLCWMLHVRDQLTTSCRKYLAARQRSRDVQLPGDSEVDSAGMDALLWARRYLPFSHFLNAEEILQDTLLSLVSELPPVTLVADALVHAFPEEEESVRVPLREKYNSLLQRLRQCSVLEAEAEEEGESMQVLLQDKLRQRRKHLRRLRRHLGPPERHLWENEEEEEERRSKHGVAVLRQLSLGASLSSTVTDCGFSTICSDGETVENISEAVSLDERGKSGTRGKLAKKRDREKTAVRIERAIQEESHPGQSADQQNPDLPALPVVGTWDFELDDDEYLQFLELFLSYVLERDGSDGADLAGEPPLLKAFCPSLRERELHSLAFDVVTTMQRRQRDTQHPVGKQAGGKPAFRAGSCYKPNKQGARAESQNSAAWNESSLLLTSPALSGIRSGRQTGLFGLQKQNHLEQTIRHRSASTALQPSPCFILSSSTSVDAVIELQEVLDPQLDSQFPELGRLLEWMLRWADRRVILRRRGKKKKPKGAGVGGHGDEAVMIRVKASAPAVLTSLRLLEQRYSGAPHGNKRFTADNRVPECTVAPELQLDQNLERESSVDTGYPGSANTPIACLDHSIQQQEISSKSPSRTDEPEELILPRMPPPKEAGDLTFYAQARPQNSQRPSFPDLDVRPEKEGKSSDSEGFDAASSLSDEDGGENIPTSETSLKLEDLNASVKDMIISPHAGSYQAPPLPETPLPPALHCEAAAAAEPLDSRAALPPIAPTDAVAPQIHPPQTSTAGVPAATPTPPPSAQDPPMRQRLGEDLIRLVQNINYVSLMEVLGASFSNLQNSSVPSLPVSSFMPQQNALTVHTATPVATQMPSLQSINPQLHQDPAYTCAQQTPAQSSQHHYTGNAARHYQDLKPLSVQAYSSDIHLRDNRRLIPPSQGLLTTTHPAAPMVAPSVPNVSAPSAISGLKLLRLDVPHQSAPHHPPAQKTISGLKLLKFDVPQQSAPRCPPAQKPGLRLLHFEPVPHKSTIFTKIPDTPPPKPRIPISVPIGETPMIRLLRLDPQPKLMFPQTMNFVPLKEMAGSVVGRQNAEVDPRTENPPAASLNSSMRQKRREKAVRAGEIGVTFRPNDSIIPAQEPEDEPVRDEAAEEISAESIAPIQIGSLDPSLTGQRLLDASIWTSAELHAFAATSKRPPEQQDAFTMTDLAHSPANADKAVSTTTADSPRSQSSGNSRICIEAPVRDTAGTLWEPEERSLDRHGRQFLSVLDLEDEMQHQDLPSFLSPETSSAPLVIPSSADLHLLAVSVIRPDEPAADPQVSIPVQENILRPTDDLEESPALGPTEANREEETAAPLEAIQPAELEIFKAAKMPSSRFESASATHPVGWFLSRMSEMDAQLAALQNIADSLERDFSNSRLLVNTIENLTPIVAPEVRTGGKKTVRLLVPKQAWTPQLDTVLEPNALEEEDESLEEDNLFSTPERKTFEDELSSSSPSHSTDINHELTGASGTSQMWEDENLCEGELSDTADEFIQEGYLSPTEMDLLSSLTAGGSGSKQQQGGWTSQERADERRELRTWMRRKSKKQMTLYLKERERLRQRESKPYSASRTSKPLNQRDIQMAQKAREDRRNAMLLEHNKQRIQENLSLLMDSSIVVPPQPGSSNSAGTTVPAFPRSTSTPSPGGNYRPSSVTTDDKRSLKSQAGQAHFSPWTAEGGPPEEYRQRPGLHRPVNPQSMDHIDRQNTRRGMLTPTTIPTNMRQGNERLVGQQQKIVTKSPSEGGAAGRGTRRTEKTANELKDADFFWRPSSETFQLSGPGVSDMGLARALDEQDDGARARATDMNWLDNLSESNGSCLSKIDWAAIERIVAEEDD